MDRHHRISAERIAIDQTPVKGGLRCSCCKRVKPAEQFCRDDNARGRSYYCNACKRIGVAMYRETPEGRAATRAYFARPEVKERQRVWHLTRRDMGAHRAQRREYEASDRGRIIKARGNARVRLRKAATDEQRARIQSLIDRHTAALAALDAEDE